MQKDLARRNAGFLLVQTEEEKSDMIQLIRDFVSLFGVKISLEEDFLVKKGDKYFLLNEAFAKIGHKDFFYAGSFLGEKKNRKFLPGFELLRRIAEQNANKIVVDKKTEWLFICGRDVFKQGIAEMKGSGKKGDYVLVMNRHGDCLGFGRVVYDLTAKKTGVVVKNILDIGDFLRRETSAS